MTEINTNTGNCNTGNCNTGNRNTGDCNTGDWNAGNCNTGNCNTGYRNTGDWNAGNRNTGYCNTGEPAPTFFDHPTELTWEEAESAIPWIDLEVGVEFVATSDMTDDEKSENPNHETIGGYLRKHTLPIQEVFPKAWTDTLPAFVVCANWHALGIAVVWPAVLANERSCPDR
ncbi:MAG: pentapeptide repeat-containing protein [Planctomycetota bacterium]